MQTLEAIYNGQAFVPVTPVHLEKNQRVLFTFRKEKRRPAEQSAAALIEFFQNSPLNDEEITFERPSSNDWRGTKDELFG